MNVWQVSIDLNVDADSVRDMLQALGARGTDEEIEKYLDELAGEIEKGEPLTGPGAVALLSAVGAIRLCDAQGPQEAGTSLDISATINGLGPDRVLH